jgi:hypothetical protein
MTKSAKQIEAEIASALAKPAAAATPKRLTAAQIKKLGVELRKAVKYAQSEAKHQLRHMEHDDYERAAADAFRATGIQRQAAAQPSDDGVEIWEIIPGVGPVGDQIASYHEPVLRAPGRRSYATKKAALKQTLTAAQRTVLGNIIVRGGVSEHDLHMGRMEKGDVRKSVVNRLVQMGLVKIEAQWIDVRYRRGGTYHQRVNHYYATPAGFVAYGDEPAIAG